MKSILVLALICIAVQSKFKQDIESIPLLEELINKTAYPGCHGTEHSSGMSAPTPKLITTTANGNLYSYSVNGQSIKLVQVFGTAEQMGYATGVLLEDEIKANINNFSMYLENNIESLLESIKVPKFIANLFGQYSVEILEGLLELESLVSAKYIPTRFKDEMKGMAQSTGIDYNAIRNINLFQELVQSAGPSSMAAAWESSTQGGNQFFTFRGLDWPANSPINENPLITVYQSSEEGSYPFANVGYAGLIGSISTVSSQQVSIQEKVWISKIGEKVKWSYIGTPFQFVLRDLAQFGTTIESLQQLLQDNGTVKIYVGMASGQSKTYNGVQYSKKTLDIFNDTNQTPYTDAHPQINNVFFWDQYTQPSTNQCFASVLQGSQGSISAETFWKQLSGLGKTGISQVCVADVYNNIVYVSYAQNGSPAYEQPIMQINLSQFYKPL